MNPSKTKRLLLINPPLENSMTANPKDFIMNDVTTPTTPNYNSYRHDLMEASTSTGRCTPQWKHDPNFDAELPSKKCKTVIQGAEHSSNGLEINARTLKGYRQQIVDLQNELNWYEASLYEKQLENLKKQKGQLQMQVPALKNALKINSLKKNRTKEKLCLMKELNGESTEAAYSEAKKKLSRCRCEYASKMASYKHIAMMIISAEKDVDICSLRVTTTKAQEELVAQIASEEKECNELNERIQEVSNNYANVFKLQLSLKSAIKFNKLEGQSIPNIILNINENINCLEGSSFSCCNSDEFDSVTRGIEAGVKNNMFKRTPLGPIGQYVAVKDDFWAPAVKTYLSSLMSCFCVDNWDDYSNLVKIFEKVLGTRPKPTIIISDFYDTVHDVRKHAVCAPEGMCSVLDVLSIGNPVITNCLIDKLEVEQMLLVPSRLEAVHLMNSPILPANIKAALTPQGVEIYPANSPVRKVNVIEEIQLKEEELAGFERFQLNLECEKARLHEDLQRNNIEVVKFEEERKILQQTLLNKKANINELKFSLKPEPSSRARLEHSEALAELNALTKEREEVLAQCRTYIETIIDSKKTIVALREMLYISYDKATLLSQQKKMQKELKKLEVDQKLTAQLLQELESEIKLVTNRIAKQQMCTNNAISQAKKGSKFKISSKRTCDELNREIEKLQNVVLQKNPSNLFAQGAP